MGSIAEPFPVKLFLAAMYAPDADIDKALAVLCERFGLIDHRFGPIEFNHTDYYTKESGSGLLKVYLSFAALFDRENLPAAKIFTNELEERFLRNGKRTINLDPGYLSRDKLVLASTKDFYHRLFLADGIYGEVTLHYRQGTFRYFSWTYPDFKEPGLHRMLQKIRGGLVGTLRGL
jgi:hypothetical protein